MQNYTPCIIYQHEEDIRTIRKDNRLLSITIERERHAIVSEIGKPVCDVI